jgi:malate synthase
VLADKRFEAGLGHDGCWVSHPFFISPALEAFTSDHQLDRLPAPPPPEALLPVGGGPRTLAGLRTNVRAAIAYAHGWRAGLGCIAWDDLMEDLATLEIARAQTWQWLRHRIALEGGATVDRQLVAEVFAEELARILDELPAGEHVDWRTAAAEAESVFCAAELRPFLTEASDAAPGENFHVHDVAIQKETPSWATTT